MKRPHISTTDTNTASPKQCQLLSLKDNECSLWDKEKLPEISGEAYCDQTLPQAFSYRKKKKKNRKTHQKKKHQHILNEKSILKTEKSHLMFFKLKS